jgi:hypothetical protein
MKEQTTYEVFFFRAVVACLILAPVLAKAAQLVTVSK